MTSHTLYLLWSPIKIQNEREIKTLKIRIDHAVEFENKIFNNFCETNSIPHDFPYHRTPKQNRVVYITMRYNLKGGQLGLPDFFYVFATTTKNTFYLIRKMHNTSAKKAR